MPGKSEGMFFNESRVYAFPPMDLDGVEPNVLVAATEQNAEPLQFDVEGDWAIYGLSANTFTGPVGTLPDGTLLNLQVKDVNKSEDFFRQSQQSLVTGIPLEHVAGKAGFPGYSSWPRVQRAGARFFPKISHQAAAAPTAKSPVRIVAHTVLLPKGSFQKGAEGSVGEAVPIGSRQAQLDRWGGYYTTFNGQFEFSAAEPLAPQETATINIPIETQQFFFVNSIWCRQENAAVGPVDAENPLIHEDPILVSMKDSISLTSWTSPDFVPLWTIAGSRAGFPYVPPTAFIVRPLGSIEIAIKNDGTANIEDPFKFTFGGILIDLPSDIRTDFFASLPGGA